MCVCVRLLICLHFNHVFDLSLESHYLCTRLKLSGHELLMQNGTLYCRLCRRRTRKGLIQVQACGVNRVLCADELVYEAPILSL